MSKRRAGVTHKKSRIKRGPTRFAKKKRMLEIKAMKPAARKKALLAGK
tara:strand:+ start:25 stop:168 length:144 start_codon:yes stop_codon:yes gene_type:complete